jgi:hypothetical protein
MPDHGVLLATCRLGTWAHCGCGWTRFYQRSGPGPASIGWAIHVAEVARG